jgi:hypothetical protein
VVQACQVLYEVRKSNALRFTRGTPGFRRDRGCLRFLEESRFLKNHGRIVATVELPGEDAVLYFNLSLEPLPLNLNEVL